MHTYNISPFECGDFRCTSKQGLRIHPIAKVPRMHNGMDLVARQTNGIPFVISVEDGTVVRSRRVKREADSGNTWQWGEYVAVRGRSGRVIYYCHLDKRLVNVGETVKAGDRIGVEGNTGYSTGRHLHFEVRDADGKATSAAGVLGIPNRVGEYYTIDDSVKTIMLVEGMKYSNGKSVPKRLWGQTFEAGRRNGNKVYLPEINSWVIEK